jgi:Beta-propeller repeat
MNTLSPLLALSVQITIWLLLVLAVPCVAESSPSGSRSAVPAATKQKLAKVQVPFIANQGQRDKEVKFYARTFAGTVFVTEAGELVYSLPKVEGKKRVKGAALKEELVGGKVTEVTGESQAVTKLNYFKGNDRLKWLNNIPTYDVVSLGEVYEGIDVKLKAYGINVEKLFYVRPGVTPETINIQISGGDGIRVNKSGELEIETEQGTVRFSKPVAFQEDGGKKEFVEAGYVVRGNEYGFWVGNYDRTRELVIDPILAATFLGGGSDELFFSTASLALDTTGNVYVAGDTFSADFPGVGPGSADSTIEEFGSEGFVVKLNSDLSSILAATFLGGSSGDSATALALDSLGNVFVAGNTASSDFPGIGPSSADSNFGFLEGFVVKLNSDLSSILAATFLGGSSVNFATALILGTTGNVYVAGFTQSSDFPGIGPGSADSTLGGDTDGFVVKLNSDLSSILAATFLGGGSAFDFPFNLAIDTIGNVYVGGETDSSDFPGIGPGSADSTFEVFEGFVAKLNSDLSSILAGTFLGGSSGDSATALILDSLSNVYVAGTTESSDFPGIGPGSADSTLGGFLEGFVVKLNSDLSAILAATFLGGSEFDRSSSLAVDTTGNVYVGGQTTSSDFPGIGPGSADSTFDEFGEGFVAKLDANLSSGPPIINDRVNFVVQSTSFSPASVPGGPAGTFTVIAVLTNKSTENILEPINAIVRTLTNGNKLLSATDGNGGVGSLQAIDAGSDDLLRPNESATVQFRIGLANRNRFSFFVDVSGTVSGDD